MILAGYDRGQVRDYISLFPESALSALFSGYFAYTHGSLWPDGDDDDEAPRHVDDPVDTVLVWPLCRNLNFVLLKTAERIRQTVRYDSRKQACSRCLPGGARL